MAKATVWFSASGYGSETRSFKSKDEAVESVKRDAAEIADEHNGEVSCGLRQRRVGGDIAGRRGDRALGSVVGA